MYLEKILLKNYRNLGDILLNLSPDLNIFVGANGQGKTNLLEAIYLLGTGSSHRTNIDSEMVNWDQSKALVQVMLAKKEQDLKISVTLEGSQKKVEINDNPLNKISDLIGNLNVVLFSPEDLKLVKGSPSYRRKFLDIEVSQVSSYYHFLLGKYNHILKQRNNLLKDIKIKNKRSKATETLEIWDEQLVEIGSKIIKKRLDVIEKLKILARLAQRKITNGSENLSIDYDFSFKENIKDKEIEVIFKQDLVNNRDRELKRGYTLCGPHRDDLILKINDIDVRKYGSQGQQRTVALALKLAELEFMKSETGEYPILLLDDVFSELDKNRRTTLVNIIAERIQTFITSTEFDDLKEINISSPFIFKVDQGKIKKGR